jgi:hypothetical protein
VNRPAAAFDLATASSIQLPTAIRAELVGHAARKLRGEHRAGETRQQQAFGLVAGVREGEALKATEAFALRRNLRTDPVRGQEIDAVVRELATDSRTPIDRRGWIAAPEEILAVQERCDRAGLTLFASYHMHKVPWAHDPLRDRPTALDTALGEGQGLWMVILSMVDPTRPILRAFWEGRPDAEAALVDIGEIS